MIDVTNIDKVELIKIAENSTFRKRNITLTKKDEIKLVTSSDIFVNQITAINSSINTIKQEEKMIIANMRESINRLDPINRIKELNKFKKELKKGKKLKCV